MQLKPGSIGNPLRIKPSNNYLLTFLVNNYAILAKDQTVDIDLISHQANYFT